MSRTYADVLLSAGLLLQLLTLNYEAKQVLSLTLIGDAGSYKNTTLGTFISVHPQALGQLPDGQEAAH